MRSNCAARAKSSLGLALSRIGLVVAAASERPFGTMTAGTMTAVAPHARAAAAEGASVAKTRDPGWAAAMLATWVISAWLAEVLRSSRLSLAARVSRAIMLFLDSSETLSGMRVVVPETLLLKDLFLPPSQNRDIDRITSKASA